MGESRLKRRLPGSPEGRKIRRHDSDASDFVSSPIWTPSSKKFLEARVVEADEATTVDEEAAGASMVGNFVFSLVCPIGHDALKSPWVWGK